MVVDDFTERSGLTGFDEFDEGFKAFPVGTQYPHPAPASVPAGGFDSGSIDLEPIPAFPLKDLDPDVPVFFLRPVLGGGGRRDEGPENGQDQHQIAEESHLDSFRMGIDQTVTGG